MLKALYIRKMIDRPTPRLLLFTCLAWTVLAVFAGLGIVIVMQIEHRKVIRFASVIAFSPAWIGCLLFWLVYFWRQRSQGGK